MLVSPRLFPRGPHLQKRWRAGRSPTPLPGPGSNVKGERGGRRPPVPRAVQPRPAARGRSRLLLALYGSSPRKWFAVGWVRSGHGGAEVGKMAWRGWAQRGWCCGRAWAAPGAGRSCEELPAALAPRRLLGRRYDRRSGLLASRRLSSGRASSGAEACQPPWLFPALPLPASIPSALLPLLLSPRPIPATPPGPVHSDRPAQPSLSPRCPLSRGGTGREGHADCLPRPQCCEEGTGSPFLLVLRF